MGSSPSKQTAQVAVSNPQQTRVGCGQCKTGVTITSKCLQCDLLLCENCRHQHLKEKSDHSVMYIKDIGKKFEIFSVKRFTTDLNYINCVLQDQGDKLWIGCYDDGVLYHIQLQDQDFTIINKINMEVYYMARLSQNKILLSIGESGLKLLDTETGKVTDSVFDVSPYKSGAVHITSNNQVIIGARGDTRGMVIVLDNKGTRLSAYAHDKHNQPIFTSRPESITSTSNGYIHVVDFDVYDGEGRVIVLDRDGHVITRYTGHPDINTYPFLPNYIVTSPADRVIVADCPSDALHILDNTGQLVTFINTKDKGILYSQSLAFMDDRHLLIGCNTYVEENHHAKLHKVKFSGI